MPMLAANPEHDLALDLTTARLVAAERITRALDGPVPSPEAFLPEAPTPRDLLAFASLVRDAEDSGALGEDLVQVQRMAHGGLYVRTARIAAGAFLVGLPHKTDHLCMCVGDITVWTPGARQRFTTADGAPVIVPAGAGATRIGYAHTGVVWVNVHRIPDGYTAAELDTIEDALVSGASTLMTRRAGLAYGGAL